jgi:rhodanese-related sulfurtransferase
MKTITVPELKQLIVDKPDLGIIDIRTELEVKDGCIPNAQWMDVSSKNFMTDIVTLPKDKTYCLYCATGGRTSMVVPFMESKGFTDVRALEGGITDWVLAGNNIVKRNDLKL